MMQRLKLHLQGVEVPQLGSLKDRVLREAMLHEDKLELKKLEFQMMIALTTPQFSEDGRARSWTENIRKIWRQTVGLTLFVDVPENSEEETQMMEYYANVVSKLRPTAKATRTREGLRIAVEGLDRLK